VTQGAVDAYVFGDDAVQIARLGQLHRWHQTRMRHEIRVVERYAEPAATLQ
jgi:hypothetical protein